MNGLQFFCCKCFCVCKLKKSNLAPLLNAQSFATAQPNAPHAASHFVPIFRESVVFRPEREFFFMSMHLKQAKVTKNTNQAPKFPRRCLQCIKIANSPNTAVCKYIDFLYSDFSDSHWILMFFTFKAPCYKYAVIIGIFCTGLQDPTFNHFPGTTYEETQVHPTCRALAF